MLFSFLSLPDELIIVIGTHLGSNSLLSLSTLSRSCKRLNKCCGSEILWKALVCELELQPSTLQDKKQNESWKEYYRKITEWKWNSKKKAVELVVSLDGKCASRPTSLGSNPAIVATLPFTKTRNFFEVLLEQLGDWICVGVATRKLKVDGGGVLSRGFFYQGTSKLQSAMSVTTEIDGVRIPDLKIGDTVGIAVDVEKNMMSFSLNGRHLQFGKLFSPDQKEDKDLELYDTWFPALGLSHQTLASFTPRIKPYLDF